MILILFLISISNICKYFNLLQLYHNLLSYLFLLFLHNAYLYIRCLLIFSKYSSISFCSYTKTFFLFFFQFNSHFNISLYPYTIIYILCKTDLLAIPLFIIHYYKLQVSKKSYIFSKSSIPSRTKTFVHRKNKYLIG